MKNKRGAIIALAHRYLAGDFTGLKYDAAAFPICSGDTLKMAVYRIRKKQREQLAREMGGIVYQCPTCGYIMAEIEYESIFLDSCPECDLRTDYKFSAALYNFKKHNSLKTCRQPNPRLRGPFGQPIATSP